MAGPSRPNVANISTTSQNNGIEMVTLPSGASYPQFLEPLTKNETALLEMYDTIKHYEKEAARLKAEEAKRRLEEADERYKAKKKAMEEAEGGGGSDENDEDAAGSDADGKPSSRQDSENVDMDHESEEDDEEAAERRKHEKEISRLRKDVNQAKEKQHAKEMEKEAAKQKEEAMRRQLLGEAGTAPSMKVGSNERKRPLGNNDNDDEDADEHDYYEEEEETTSQFTGQTIKKKRVDDGWDDTTKPKASLIANIGGHSTPIHDFSKNLAMSKVSLDGSVVFPHEGHIPWEPPHAPQTFLDGHLELELPDFDATMPHSSNNTIAIKFHAPQESKRFSLNIAAPNNEGYSDVLFHFNPRHFQKGGRLVINDRNETMWGNDLSVPLSTMPLMFGVQSCTLIVQINEEGFDVFVEGQHCARLEHRTLLPKSKGSLFLQFPSSDDYGNPENWMVYRVWWGRKQSMADDLNGVAGVNIYSSVHPKKLFISGLSKLHTDPELDLRRAELERAFRKYGGPSGAVAVSVQKNSTFAFVEVASEQQADLALMEMMNSGRYRVNKARRTKHEALTEERAAKESKEKGTTKESVDWD